MNNHNSNLYTKLVNQEVLLGRDDFLTLKNALSHLFDESVQLDDLIKDRYMDQRSLVEVINPSDHKIDGMMLIRILDTLQNKVCKDATQTTLYWKTVSALIIQSYDERPKQLGVSSSSSLCKPVSPKVGSVKTRAHEGKAQPCFAEISLKPIDEVVPEQVLVQLSQLRLSANQPLYRTKYQHYIRCRKTSCEYCSAMFYHMSLTKCSSLNHGDIPCHHTGYYPHVGLRLWKQLRARHDSGDTFKPTTRSKGLKYTLYSYELLKGLTAPSPSYDDNIDTNSPDEIPNVASTLSIDDDVIYCPLSPELH